MAQISKHDLSVIRITTAKLTLGVLQTLNRARFQRSGDLGANLDMIVIGLGIYIGQHEGRPFTTAKLALYLGMKRPTVHRRIKQLVEAGIVQRIDSVVTYRDEWLNAPVTYDSAATFAAMFAEAFASLSNLDTKIVDT
jgi:hypothetical protein